MDFNTLLKGSAREHGHLCPGQVIGVRMSLLGLELIGLENPKQTRDIKKLIVYVEMDRCAADAISYVTGVSLGRRSLKFKDYGIMAATFINLETQQAYRILSTEHSRELADKYAPEIEDPHTRQLEAYKKMPLSELFEVSRVNVDITNSSLPGPATYKTACSDCGIIIRDAKEINTSNGPLCHACAGQAYYRPMEKVIL